MKLEITIDVMDVQMHLPSTNYDEQGDEIPWAEGEFEKMWEEAKGKVFLRLSALMGGRIKRFESAQFIPKSEETRTQFENGLKTVTKSAAAEFERQMSELVRR